MAEFGNGLAEESLLDSDPGHPELEDPGVGDEEPGLEEGEAAIEDPVSEGHCFSCESPHEYRDTLRPNRSCLVKAGNQSVFFLIPQILGHMPCVLLLSPGRY